MQCRDVEPIGVFYITKLVPPWIARLVTNETSQSVGGPGFIHHVEQRESAPYAAKVNLRQGRWSQILAGKFASAASEPSQTA